MSTPIERGAEAIFAAQYVGTPERALAYARAVFESIPEQALIDALREVEDEVWATVMEQARVRKEDQDPDAAYRVQVSAIKAHLLGGA